MNELEHLNYKIEFLKTCLVTARIAYDRSWSHESKARYQISINNYEKQIADIEAKIEKIA